VLASLNLAFDLAAQQTAAAAATASAAATSPVSASAAPAPAADAGEADAKAAQLIHKLDQALAGDDHLL